MLSTLIQNYNTMMTTRQYKIEINPVITAILSDLSSTLTLFSWYKSSVLSLVSFWWSQIGLSELGNKSVNVGSADSAVW